MNAIEKFHDPIAQIENTPPVRTLLEELNCGLFRFRNIADGILMQSGVRLKDPLEEDFSLTSNFFSFLFFYSFYRANISAQRRTLYGAVIQCLRGMVTGCDNLLDDEYKKTLDTDIPETGHRFRSVVDIMVSDRVIFQLLLEAMRNQEITLDQMMAANAASMKTITRSGVQEASEEAGITAILKPEDLLQTVHHHKTGILFTSPWDIPLVIEQIDESDIKLLLEGLYRIGMGCQIMDDMVDFFSDLSGKRHNYLVSLIYHGENRSESSRLRELLLDERTDPSSADPLNIFPGSMLKASRIAHQFLESGLRRVFSPEHQLLIKPSIQFLVKRLGVSHLFRHSPYET